MAPHPCQPANVTESPPPLTRAALRDLIETLPEPVFAVNAAGRIVMASRSVKFLLNKEPATLEGLLGGEAFDCPHAREPGGCGQQVHCRSCVIRHSVTDTFTRGVAHCRVAACLDAPDAPDRPIAYLISTELVGGVVLLKVERPAP